MRVKEVKILSGGKRHGRKLCAWFDEREAPDDWTFTKEGVLINDQGKTVLESQELRELVNSFIMGLKREMVD